MVNDLSRLQMTKRFMFGSLEFQLLPNILVSLICMQSQQQQCIPMESILQVKVWTIVLLSMMWSTATLSWIAKSILRGTWVRATHVVLNLVLMDNFWLQVTLMEKCGFGIGRRVKIIERWVLMKAVWLLTLTGIQLNQVKLQRAAGMVQ